MKQEKFNACASTLQEGCFGIFSLPSHSYYNSHVVDNFDKKKAKLFHGSHKNFMTAMKKQNLYLNYFIPPFKSLNIYIYI